ncbi:plasmid mobilization protein [Sinomicrobium weinanense]|uniref:Plasmid mobilization relaxosome protein MobC n=1 Tax=Sinomicrobium weinanense TaxID=2842200 RepID=A0A926Q5J2_9FLAO|nr:plasmid mobilization relaxosome protein MobC [Sinomicrobium weinanense]MBC9798221.1 plasmid mobilization relaxosome protein MobC [Sinomicrobium weinanense]MBU3122879.1 plasmid mobilization relaxosome protein MobC [Sinomicrobium weinanense]
MMKEKVNRTRMVHVRLTHDEYQKLQQRFQKTTCRKFSEYLRHCLFDKPVTTTYRNTSLDDFMIEMSALKKELNHIGNNYNQAVKKLHTLWRIEEFRKWITMNERDKIILFVKIDAIEHHLKKMAEVWLR